MKKISQFIAYGLVGLLAVAVILCAIIKLDYKPEMQMPNLNAGEKIQIEKVGTSMVDAYNDNINATKFIKEFENSFKLTVLHSLFSGNINNAINTEKQAVTSPTFNEYQVMFVYNETQTLTQNGEPVYIADNSSTPITYDKVFFSVYETNGVETVTLYFYNKATKKYKPVETIANFDGLYDMIQNMTMFAE